MSPLMSYQDVLKELGYGRQGRIHLLLGNGFSISCDQRFSYDNLYSVASEGFTDRITGMFSALGENNFEGVLKLIDSSACVARLYGYEEMALELDADSLSIKDSLITSLVGTHMVTTGELEEVKKIQCGSFLAPYWNVFTTNYDLLLYWVEMANPGLQGNDGFREDQSVENADYVVFSERAGDKKSIFFLHGALHFYRKSGQLRKHTWCRTDTPLIAGIQNGFTQSQYPLFVAEGSAEKKMQQILGDPYLDYCLGKLGRVKDALVIFGMSFGDSDNHILDVISRNRSIHKLYVGLFGEERADYNVKIKSKLSTISDSRDPIKCPLTVKFYNSSTANVWAAN